MSRKNPWVVHKVVNRATPPVHRGEKRTEFQVSEETRELIEYERETTATIRSDARMGRLR